MRRMGAEFYADRQTDGRTDMTKLTVAFRNFANAPENLSEATFRNMVCIWNTCDVVFQRFNDKWLIETSDWF
jgi:hypothetical protein